MFELEGKYSKAKVFTDKLDNASISQIIELLNQPFVEDSKIRIMPDAHKGAGCVIGFTADLGDKVIPNLVGVDIGCGILTVNLGKSEINLEELDNVISKFVPSGFHCHAEPLSGVLGEKLGYTLERMYCYDEIKKGSFYLTQVGTLGGGNHFIELSVGKDGNKYLIIHSGSRNLGKTVADYYQELAVEYCKGKDEYLEKREQVIRRLKDEGRQQEISRTLKNYDKAYEKSKPSVPSHLCYLEGNLRNRYLNDMKIAQDYALVNRSEIARIILRNLSGTMLLSAYNFFHTIHNYISFDDGIIRKGAVSSAKGEELLIPINMRDGSLLCKGKGNPDWNFSAPHGAGRLMSRSQAKKEIVMADFENSMDGIYTTSVGINTLDEAPQAYKSMEEIVNNIQDTVDIIGILRPIYNYKAH